MRNFLYGMILLAFLIIPPVRNTLESIMITHMLVQIPLLIVSGWLMADVFQERFKAFFTKWNENGIAGILLVIFITAYWMIPLNIDRSLEMWSMELFKFGSLPLLAGIPLRDSWKKISSLVKSFIIFNYISMFGLLAWIYIEAPVRVCNSYLESDQEILGWGFLVITVSLILYMLQNVFADQSEASP
ncbi:hypothetical protein [Lentibacillus sp. CBA3610]|uniref:hypothetical protein n=1 Tax=Lentibacillus sp. CBA3610 TaxID=2518176 RepID=UPI001595AFAB|nr:hypothetical protein [Lentibacillus sp. CBA3610]QKY69924.1 hypothetical protein Len3610_10280 [Lentibacillus sp. CBA3610]